MRRRNVRRREKTLRATPRRSTRVMYGSGEAASWRHGTLLPPEGLEKSE
jgi:hypothetical protein